MRPLEAVAFLHDGGGHFVLCHGKRPIWPRWQRRRPGLDTVVAHGQDLGLIPWSIRTSALDVDHGEVGELVEATSPLVTLQSPRGHHCYYEDCEGRGNANWDAFGCQGDVRSARGFLRLYEGGAERLASALRTTPSGTAPFPADLFEAMGVEAPRMLPVEAPRIFRVRAPDDLPILTSVRPGGRNNALFEHVRYWAYPQDKGKNLAAWVERVERIASEFNELFPVCLAAGEVNKLAWSVASWTWSGGGPMDHSPAAQRRRGIRSGSVRRAATRERDKAMVAMRDDGASWRQIGAAFGVSHMTAKRGVERAKVYREPITVGGFLLWLWGWLVLDSPALLGW